MARSSINAADRDALKQLFGDDFVEAPTKPSKLEAKAEASVSEPVKENTMNPLAKTYLAGAIQNITRMPSPKLKDDFRATLNHWRSLTIAALRTSDEPTAFVNVVMAIVETEGSFDALRLIRNAATQILWQASVDVQRDRRLASELEVNTFQDGEPDHVDADYVAPATEFEAIDALVEAHGWLSTVADLLPNDEDDRIRLGLESGLEFTQVKQGDEWVRVYDVNEAIQAQLEKNRASMQRRDGKRVLERKDAILALARLAA